MAGSRNEVERTESAGEPSCCFCAALNKKIVSSSAPGFFLFKKRGCWVWLASGKEVEKNYESCGRRFCAHVAWAVFFLRLAAI
jgi:hypothetical protein